MTRFIQQGPLWRRSLLSMAAMLGASAAFVGIVMLLLGSVVDMAVAPESTSLEAEAPGSTEPTKAASGAHESKTRQFDTRQPKTHDDKGSRRPGGRS